MGIYELREKVVWIVGASGAIGEAAAKQFAEYGARLVLSSRSHDALRALAASIRGDRHLIMPLDATDQNAVEMAAARIIAGIGRIDVLINSTTRPLFRDFTDLSDDDWLAVLDAKLLAYVRTCRAVLPHMTAAGGGAIVNVSGRGGHQPGSPAHFAGSCSNGAVNTLTKGLALHYKHVGVRVNAVAPGPVVSERFDKIAKATREAMEKRPATSVTKWITSEIATPEAIADTIVYLASERARHLTGIVLQADGGTTPSL